MFLVILTQGSGKSRTKLEATGTRTQLRKKRKVQVETFKQKGHRLQHEFNTDIMEDLQDIIGNISHEQDPLSMSLKAVISKLKKRNKLRLWIQQNGAGQLQQSTKRSELGGLQMTVSEYDKQKQEL